MSANKPLSERPVQGGQSCRVMDSDPSMPVGTERPPTDLPAPTERPPTDLPAPSERPPTDLPGAIERPPTDLPAATERPPTDLPAPSERPPTDLPAAIARPPTDLPAPIERPPTDLPAAIERPPTDLPAAIDRPPTDLPAAIERPPTDLPAAIERPPTDLPAALERPPTDLPAAIERPPTDLPAAIERPPTDLPAAIERPPTDLPAAIERPPTDLAAAIERPPTDLAVLSGTLPGVSEVEPSIQVRAATGFHHNAVSCTSGGTAVVVQRNASGAAAPKRRSVGPQVAAAAASPVCFVSRLSTPGASGGTAVRMPQLTRPPWTPLGPGRTMVIALPRTASPQAIAVATRPPRPPPQQQQQPAAAQLPANFQIPAGMVLIRSESGQLMLVSQQALVQVQQGQRAASVPEPRPPSVQVAHVGDNKTSAVRKEDKVTIIRLAAPPTVHKTAVSKAPRAAVVQTLNAVVPPVRKPASQDPPPTITQETLENVKKCKNFLVTLIRLASSGSQSAAITSNVKGLVKSLLDGSVEAEEFTAQLYKELKSTPQPYLLPFLKKSLPAVRHLTSDPQLFVQQADQPKPQKTNALLTGAPVRPPPAHITAGGLKPSLLVTHQPKAVTLRASFTRPAPAQPGSSKNNRPTSKHMVLQSRQHHSGPYAFKQPLVHDPPPSNRGVFKVNAGSYREDDDINDVASMAGVNVREEKAKIFSSGCVAVGSVLQSCQDEPFLPVSLLLECILHTGQCVGVTDVAPEVTAVLSHATQERLRGLLEKLTAMAQRRKTLLKEDMSQEQVSDVRSQLSFMEDIDTLKKRRQDEEERERLLRIARSRWTTDDPLYQQLKQQAKELQQLEQAQQLHREANITALAAIGPRKKRPLQTPGNQVPVLCRVSPVQRVTRVTLRDLLLCLEEDRSLRHSVILYKALLA